MDFFFHSFLLGVSLFVMIMARLQSDLFAQATLLTDGVLGDNTPGKLAKGNMLVQIDLVAQVWLGEHGQSVARNATTAGGGAGSPDKVRHGLELAARDALQGLARLEGDAVAGDLDLYRLARAGLDVQTGSRVW